MFSTIFLTVFMKRVELNGKKAKVVHVAGDFYLQEENHA